MNCLMKYDFPGNVRELENIIQRAVVLTRNNVISMSDLPKSIIEPVYFEFSDSSLNILEIGDLNVKVEQLEVSLIDKALKKTGGNQVKAAELLNISERTLRYKLSKLKEE